MRDVTETVGRWLIVNHKHDDYASTALTFVNVTNTTKLYGDEKKTKYYFLNVKKHVQVHFTIASQFQNDVNAEFYIHAFIHLRGGEKQVC